MKKFKEFKLDGVLSFDDGREVGFGEFFDIFIEMIESKGMIYGGSVDNCEDEPSISDYWENN